MVYLIMGVSGSGKTTIALNLATILGINFLDADNLHSKKNIAKMKKGIALNDEDRMPWLLKINSELSKISLAKKETCLACSALKESYRKVLLKNIDNYLIIYLRADLSLLQQRLEDRKKHFFHPKLLSSQLSILEEPKEKFIAIDSSKPTHIILNEIITEI